MTHGGFFCAEKGDGMKKLIATAIFIGTLMSTPTTMAQHRLVDSVGVDRIAHAGVSYLICDQLRRNAGMNHFWAATTTLAIGALKEWSDGHWDGKDFAADCAGVLMYQVRF
mgnify:FL=1|jgi:hypothetical protein